MNPRRYLGHVRKRTMRNSTRLDNVQAQSLLYSNSIYFKELINHLFRCPFLRLALYRLVLCLLLLFFCWKLLPNKLHLTDTVRIPLVISSRKPRGVRMADLQRRVYRGANRWAASPQRRGATRRSTSENIRFMDRV